MFERRIKLYRCDKPQMSSTVPKRKTVLIIDFERGLMNACKTNLKGFSLIGDIFHMKNKLWLSGVRLRRLQIFISSFVKKTWKSSFVK
jgi:hypothetical protein